MALIATLKGRDLVCAPLRCHCDVILRLANPERFTCDSANIIQPEYGQ